MTILLVLLLLLPFFDGRSEAADFSYIPFLYKIPEGSVGVFRNGNQFYDDVYPAGFYPVWPSDEGFTISILPQKVAVTKVSCITVEGVKITIPEITVHYQVHEGGALDLVKVHGIDFVKPLIKNPVKQGVANLCATMTAESIYLEELAILTQYISEFLAKEQGDNDSGLSISKLEITRPPVPDEIIANDADQNQPTNTCDQPYEIFYTLEDEKEARERLCGSGYQYVEDRYNPFAEDDISRVMEPGPVASAEPATAPAVSMEVHSESFLQPDPEIPSEGVLHRQVIDPLIDGEDTYDVEAVPAETRPYQIRDNLKGGREPIESVYSEGLEVEKYPAQPIGQSNEESSQDERKRDLHQQRQHSRSLWKNNNSRLYLGW